MSQNKVAALTFCDRRTDTSPPAKKLGQGQPVPTWKTRSSQTGLTQQISSEQRAENLHQPTLAWHLHPVISYPVISYRASLSLEIGSNDSPTEKASHSASTEPSPTANPISHPSNEPPRAFQ
jgi:hypothetical protein